MDPKLKKMAIDIALNRPSGDFSMEDLEKALRGEVDNLVGNGTGGIDYYKWNDNKNAIFALIGTMIDAKLPKNVSDTIGQFAEIKMGGHGDKPRFQLKLGARNVKRFVTRVAAAGVYERTRLDRGYVDVDTYAHGGAVYQTLEGFLAGRESISELLGIFLEELENATYEDIAVALQGTYSDMPAANIHTHSGFDGTNFNRILSTVRAYGVPTIFCTQTFASTIIPASGFVGDLDRLDMRNNGYIGKYNGADVVVLPQSFTDETNTVKVIDDQYAYIMPAGANEEPVKVYYEGDTLIREVQREDWSAEMQIYKKLGIAIVHNNHFGIYKNSSL